MGKITALSANLITIKKGGILHGVNTQGKMNSGVAKDIREKYPQVYLDYIDDINLRVIRPIKQNNNAIFKYPVRHQALRKELLGSVVTTQINPSLVVLSGYTQQFYGYDGQVYADIDAIVKSVLLSLRNETVMKHGLYMPMIGCGLGGLRWKEVSKAIRAATPSDTTITLCVLK